MVPGYAIDGKYEIVRLLGTGGMGSVYAATHRVLGTSVAIKVLHASMIANPELRGRFLREARAAGRLLNEHVCKVIDVGSLPDGAPYLVMEMLQGYDLASLLIKQGPLPQAIAADYIIQACEGLAEAHRLGMIHRDIKPANLFVATQPNGRRLIKVLDFGITTAAHGDVDHGMTSTQAVMGSPAYMSPEQLLSAKDVDARSDVWSFGVTLYELIAGRPPFTADSLTGLSIAITMRPHAPLTDASAEIAAVVDRCLAKSPADRFASVADLATALAPVAPDGAVAARNVAATLHGAMAPALTTPPAPPTRSNATTAHSAGQSLAMPTARRGWLWAGGGLALVALAAAILISRHPADGQTASGIAPVVRPQAPVVVVPPAPPLDAKPAAVEPDAHVDVAVDPVPEVAVPEVAVPKKAPTRRIRKKRPATAPATIPSKQKCRPDDPTCGL